LNVIKKLAGQTAIYGVSSILARILNQFLTPFYILVFVKASIIGQITLMYSYVAFFMILLTFGLETAFFNFSTKSKEKSTVYSTSLTFLAVTSVLFIILGSIFSQNLANIIGFSSRPDFVVYFAFVLSFDAFSSIPMARLRQEGKAKKFALINVASIGANIFFSLFFLWYCKGNYDEGNTNWLIDLIYHPEIGIGYVFLANLLASLTKLVLLHKEIILVKWQWNFKLLKQMMIYGLPLMVAGFAGIINETFDKILLQKILTPKHGIEYAQQQIGIYGGVYKLSIIISLFIQAYRYAAEPFFFAKSKDKDAKSTYAYIMSYFVIAVTLIFLGVLLYLDIFKWIFVPREEFWIGLKVVPILLLANICLGIYYNQSIWYKLSGQTKFGAYFAIGGAILTIILNVIFIPYFGFVASAWATLATYAGMMFASYFFGQKHYPIPYNLKKIGFYLALTFTVYGISVGFKAIFPESNLIILSFNTFLFTFYLWFIYKLEGIDIKSLLKNK
jgi:O-antigen/teichoic acid export membrane protein